MIVVTGVIELDSEDVWPATTAAAKMARETEKEAGCITYRFYVDVLNSKRFRVYEEWESEAALSAHFKTPHMAEFQQKLKDLRVVSRKIVKYTVGESTLL